MTDSKPEDPYQSPQANDPAASADQPGCAAMAAVLMMSVISGGIALSATCTGIMLLLTFFESFFQTTSLSRFFPLLMFIVCVPTAIWFALRRSRLEWKKRDDAARKTEEQV